MRPSKLVLTVIAGLILLVAGLYAAGRVYVSLLDQENPPLCHKQALMAMHIFLERDKTDDLPNVGGRSDDSLRALEGEDSLSTIDDWIAKYRYVPGLRKGDPGDLVLMYMPAPTRFIFHGNPQTILAEPKWMLVPLDFTDAHIGQHVPREIALQGEDSERVSLAELKQRLQTTLQFLRDNDRPHWQTVAAENEALLKTTEQ